MHSFGCCVDHETWRNPGGVLPGVCEKAVQGGIVMLRLMMEENESGTSSLGCEIHRLSRCRVSPAGARLNDLVQVHGVMDQRVGSLQKSHQPRSPISRYLVAPAGAELVVGEICQLVTSGGRSEPVAESGTGMP